MRRVFFPLLLVAACLPALAQRTYNLGSVAPPEEVKVMDHVIGPAGKELPPGSGTAKDGTAVYARQCAACHGQNGIGGTSARLVTPEPGKIRKGTVNYYPYATIAYDFISRSMPANKPGSLTADEVYSVTAFLLFKNGIIKEDDVMDAKSLPAVQMPNRNGFVPAQPWPAPAKPSWY
ncbi:MAG: c-type cytochrome [Bryobacterales bacterium]|nr:c-type cytochrome [Bryobacterales bacterium]